MPKKSAVSASNETVTEATDKKKRVFRSPEERKAEIDKKIAFHAAAIETLEAKKAKIGTGHRTRKASFSKVVAELKASGMSPEQILEKFRA